MQQSLNNLACELKAGPGSTGSVSSRATALLPGTALVIRGGHKNFAGQKLGIKKCVLQDSCKKQYVFPIDPACGELNKGTGKVDFPCTTFRARESGEKI